jgi:hypothetical protein
MYLDAAPTELFFFALLVLQRCRPEGAFVCQLFNNQFHHNFRTTCPVTYDKIRTSPQLVSSLVTRSAHR